ncbi:MAG: hypothetical protein PQJ48_05370 [Sphaerochaetaceae bacterium]|nr:hypothetical protein [Sphaerochaetaceae bacterium]
MGGLLVLGAVAGGLMGAINGRNKAAQREAEYQDKLEDLNRQKTLLDTGYNQAKQSYNLGVEQAKAGTAEANTELNLLAEETLANRDMALEQTATAGSMQSTVNALQLATLEVQNTQQTGAARQQAATSGFRGTGTAQARVENAISAGATAKDTARKQNQIARYQTYTSALNNYVSANQQEAAYRRKITQNNNALEREIGKLDLQLAQAKETYELKGGYLASDINYLKTEGRKALDSARKWDIIGGGFGGFLQGMAMFA